MKQKKVPNAKQLLAAINRHDAPMLRKLLAEGADANAKLDFIDANNLSVLACAAATLFTEGIDILLEAGADPNSSSTAGPGGGGGDTALHSAIHASVSNPKKGVTESDRHTIIGTLLEAGANPNWPDNRGYLPLTSAASAGNYEVMKQLIAGGATVKSWPPGATPPLLGSADGAGTLDDKIAHLLLENGAPIDGENVNGVTALMVAAYRGSEQHVALFLEHGADPSYRAKDGKTPLISAALYARDVIDEEESQLALRIIKQLLDAGATLEGRIVKWGTALDIASISQFPACAEYLKNFSAKTNK